MKNKKFQIVINGDGDTTEARMFIDGKLIRCAQAQRNPDDKPNWKIAAELAFGRLWDKKAEVTQKPAPPKCSGHWRVVSVRPFQPLARAKPGDFKGFREVERPAAEREYIRIKKPFMSRGAYSKGDILRVLQADPNSKGVWVLSDIPRLGQIPVYVAHSEYVVLEVASCK